MYSQNSSSSDLGECAVQSYNGGIMFVSYLISVVGAQTTLELLSKRTHIRGVYNWFLLTAAAFVMGAVSVWSMHFIGNNSMTLLIYDKQYQLSYNSAYTFASLIVAIVCMFLAFIFVGITEDAKLIRIIPSGIFAGLGIACMHYMGQFAVDFFILVYEPAYVAGAIIIACAAVTIALFIFFKLREKWINQWYKRLGCSLLMAIAVCGMHYTGLVGTRFYIPNEDTIPIPKLKTAALIGIIAAIIVIACIVLLYISVRAGIKHLPKYMKNTNKRLILDAVIFDPTGRILVKVDGTLPMTEIVHNLELNETKQDFNTHHPLFIRLFETTIQKASTRIEKRPSNLSRTSTMNTFDSIENQFLESCRELREELRFNYFGDLGILSDIVITTDTIAKPPAASLFSTKGNPFLNNSSIGKKKYETNGQSMTEIELTFNQIQSEHASEDDDNYPRTTPKSKWRRHRKSRNNNISGDEEAAVDTLSSNKRSSGSTTVAVTSTHEHRSSSEDTRAEDGKSVNDRLSVEDSDGEDKHIFLVRKLVSENEVDRLLAQGYRFAESVFIAKTMGAKLRIPSDHMRHHFIDMQQMADSICALTQHDWTPSTVEPAPNPTLFNASTKSAVYMGGFVLIDETKDLSNIHIVLEKAKRYSFPLAQLKLSHSNIPTHLEPSHVEFLFKLQGHSLFDVANLRQTIASLRKQANSEHKLNVFDKVPDSRFLSGLESAAQQLLETTAYNKALFQHSKLHASILDLPPFSLTTGPSQLILFKSFVSTQGAIAAINHTFSESIKCIPLPLYAPLCGFMTDQAATIYQANHKSHSLPTYLVQQQMYRQQTTSHRDSKKMEEDVVIMMDTFKEDVVEKSKNEDPFSLPPPPRAKRNRFKLTSALLNSPVPDTLSPLQDGSVKTLRSTRNLKALQAAPLTVLTTQDRFWWINSIIEETIHSSI